jgi:hypothetical protein
MKMASHCGASKRKPTETVETVTLKTAGKRLREESQEVFAGYIAAGDT